MRLSCCLLLGTSVLTGAAAPTSATATPPAAYDEQLCALAQRMLVNADGADPAPFTISVLRGVSNGFHTIQMDVDAATRTVVIATTSGSVQADGKALTTHVACKLVDRERVNDVLGLALAGPGRSCRDVNEHTYRLALESLSPDERQRYAATGRPLRFGADHYTSTGAEWLPVAVEKYITATAGTGTDPGYLEIRAPAVVVPWSRTERQFFQGTHHCKLITLAALQHWMRVGALTREAALFPSAAPVCDAPSSMTSTAGSCVFYFAPANARYCQDYSGPEWKLESARQECGKRHASPEALKAAANRYAGAGGLFSDASCRERPEQLPLAGTCVFHCKQPDEALWHPLATAAGDASSGAAGAMMSKACDLFVP